MKGVCCGRLLGVLLGDRALDLGSRYGLTTHEIMMIMERARWRKDTKTMRKTQHVVLIGFDNSVAHLMSRRYLSRWNICNIN
jgi:hypothetical protein